MNHTELLIGHSTDAEAQTGLSVFLMPQAAECGAWVCGSAPGSRDIIFFTNSGFTVSKAHALLFTGGSAYGLDAAAGVMRWLKEHNRGISVGRHVVPIVPTACIFGLDQGAGTAPSADAAYAACQNAHANPLQGMVGAGTGARVGKLFSNAEPMPGGFGWQKLQGPDGLEVSAYVVGNVINQHSEIVAGARHNSGFMDPLQNQYKPPEIASIGNTILVATFCNASFHKDALIRIAKMASAGIARSISPSFTSYDGDIVFSFALGAKPADELTVGAFAAEAVRQAILSAVDNTFA